MAIGLGGYIMMRCRILVVAAICGLTTAAHAQDLGTLENMLLFFPNKTLNGTPARIGLTFDEVFLKSTDQVKIHAWWVPCGRSRATLIFSHGNAGNISHRLEKLKIFHGLGLDVFLYDYRGYGKSTGSPSEAGLYADAQAAYDFVVKEKHIPRERIISYGESLGGPVAAHLASKNEVGATILDSTFTSLKDMARVHYPVLAPLTQSKFDTLADVRTVEKPVLVLHSTDDEVVPYSQGQQLFKAATGPKQFVELRGDHNGGFMKSRTNYVKGLGTFLNAHVPRPKH
jgi:uncharacterized protein